MRNAYETNIAMNQETGISYVAEGHEEMLGAAIARHRLRLERKFISGHTTCAVGLADTGERVFIKVKAYAKNDDNKNRWRRAINAIKLSSSSAGLIAPKVLRLRAFENSNAYWLVISSVYGGAPMSSGMFFEGDGARIDDDALGRLERCIQIIQQVPSPGIFYLPQKVASWITMEFGSKVQTQASTWTSAHCDLHWGNILEGARYVVDWDMLSLAPKGFDAASLVLFSCNEQGLFSRLREIFADELNEPSGQIATLFAGARLLRIMRMKAFSELRVNEKGVRAAVEEIVPNAVLPPSG